MKNLLFLLVIILLWSCSKDDGTTISDDKIEGPGYLQLFEEKILSSLSDTVGLKLLNKINIEIQDSCFLVYGNKNKKLWIGIFDPNTLKNEWTWTSNKDYFCIHKEHIGYGDTITLDIDIDKIHLIVNPYKIIDNNNFILELRNEWEKYNYLLFVSNGVERFNIDNKYYIKEWYDNTILYHTSWKYTIYSLSGEIILQGEDNGIENLIPINMYEGIGVGLGDELYRTNISTGIRKWATNSFHYLFKLEKDVRYELEKTKEDGNDWHYKIDVTNKDGSKKTINFKIEIDTGVITEI